MKEPINTAPYEDYKAHSLNFKSNEMYNTSSEILLQENKEELNGETVLSPDFHHTADSLMKEKVLRILMHECKVDLSKIQVKVSEGDVTIEGVVPREKLPLIDKAIEEAGPRDVQNRLRADRD